MASDSLKEKIIAMLPHDMSTALSYPYKLMWGNGDYGFDICFWLIRFRVTLFLCLLHCVHPWKKLPRYVNFKSMKHLLSAFSLFF